MHRQHNDRGSKDHRFWSGEREVRCARDCKRDVSASWLVLRVILSSPHSRQSLILLLVKMEKDVGVYEASRREFIKVDSRLGMWGSGLLKRLGC